MKLFVCCIMLFTGLRAYNRGDLLSKAGFIEEQMVLITDSSSMSSRQICPKNGGDPFGKPLKTFYLSKGEIENQWYLFYLNDLKPKTEDDTIALLRYSNALPDTLVWRRKLSCSEPYVEYYFRHPAYFSYPVVGVSHQQCLNFCEWLTNYYHQFERRKYKEVKFSLPSRTEWQIALGTSAINPHDFSRGPVNRNLQSKNKDSITTATPFYAAAQRSNLKYIGTASNLNDRADLTTPSVSFQPNAFGLYNMLGNLQEFVAEKGFACGASWRDSMHVEGVTNCRAYNEDEEVCSYRGFRVKMEIIKE